MDLFSPISLGAYRLPHRVVMAPMTRGRSGKGQVPTPLNATYYAQRANAALIITEATQISLQGIGYPSTPGIHTADQIQGWKCVTQAVHSSGGRIFAQLWHVGRISHPSMQPGNALPVAPSPVRPRGEAFTYDGPKPFVTPRALELEEIKGIIADYRHAAESALKAGFDGVELHAANGYLIDQFLRDGVNRRQDRYGGSVANRAHLLLEIVDAVLGVWDASRVGVRLSPMSSFNDMADSNPKRTFSYAIRALDEWGLAYLHLIETGVESAADGARLDSAYFRPLFRGRLIANGGYDRHKADAAIGSGAADLVSFGELYLANPDLPQRLIAGGPFNAPDRACYYSGGASGYTDYPALDPQPLDAPAAAPVRWSPDPALDRADEEADGVTSLSTSTQKA